MNAAGGRGRGETEAQAPAGLAPVVDAATEILILGSFPSRASLAAGQYYGHAQNQFWRILAAVLEPALPAMPYAQRCACLLRHRVGLWDVVASCEREGSLDRAIRNARLNDFAGLSARAPRLSTCVFNGGAAWRLGAAVLPAHLEGRRVPSSSPAHASLRLEAKALLWARALGRPAASLV